MTLPVAYFTLTRSYLESESLGVSLKPICLRKLSPRFNTSPTKPQPLHWRVKQSRKQMKSLVIAIVFLSAMTSAFADSWSYSEDVDKMTSKKANYASLSSANSLSLGFPYAGANYGNLTVRKHSQYRLSVILSIDKGQILCPSYSGCSVKIRFGDKSPLTFRASPAADHDSKTVFLGNAQGFIDQALKVKSIKAQVNIYHSGGSVLEFESTGPLVWSQMAKAKT